MRKQPSYLQMLVFLSLLLCSTTALPMIQSICKQRKEQRLRKIETIDHKIKDMHDDAYNNCLKEMANLTGESLSKLKEHFDYEREQTQIFLKNPNPDVTHDPNMPAASYQKWQTIMHSEGINPQSTAMQYERNSEQESMLAQAGSPIFLRNRLLSQPIIVEYPILSKLPEETQEYARRHECKHLKLQHLSMRVIATSINPNGDPKPLVSAQEIEADLHAASVNSKIACTGAFLQCFAGHTDIIDQDKHCQDMMRMCALMRYKEELS